MKEVKEYCECGLEMDFVGIFVICPVCDVSVSADNPCHICGHVKNENGFCNCKESYS